MKQLFLIYCFILLIGQFNVYGSLPFQTDDVNPLIQLKASLSIKANVYYGDEDEESFQVSTDFYLLDESLVKILKTAKFKPVFLDRKRHRITDEDYLEATAKAFSSDKDEESQMVSLLIRNEITKHQISTAKTNYLGKGNFKAIKTGNYYLFAIAKTEDEVFVWNLPVEIKSGINSIEIDQYNAETVLSLDE